MVNIYTMYRTAMQPYYSHLATSWPTMPNGGMTSGKDRQTPVPDPMPIEEILNLAKPTDKPPKPDKPGKNKTIEPDHVGTSESIHASSVSQDEDVETTGFSRVPLGPGGFISGTEIHADGTMICRMDTSGAYRWDSETSRWVMMVTTYSMPTDVTSPGYGPNNGAYAIAIAPSDSNRIYMAWQHLDKYLVMRSDDAGLTFQHTNYIAGSSYEWNGNGVARGSSKRMAVDTHDEDIVLLGTMSGVKLTVDGGDSWAVMELPATTNIEFGYLVAIDHVGMMYVMVMGVGVYTSANMGTTWTLAASDGPVSASQMIVTHNGCIMTVTDYWWAHELYQPIHIFEDGEWRTVQPDPNPHAILSGIAVDPHDDNHIVVCDNEGNVSSSFDQGATWLGFAGHHYSCPEIPWLNNMYGGGGEWAMYGGGIQFDPGATNKIYMGFGLGIAYGYPPNTPATKMEWRDTSLGLEQLCAKRLIKPQGNPNVILAVMDQGVFSCDGENYPASKGVLPYFAAAWDCDWCPDDPNTVIVLINQGNGGPPDHSGISRDGGITWNVFGSNPYHRENHAGGMIACGTDPDNFIIITGDFGTDTTQLHYTRDGGETWYPATMPAGIPPSGDTGWNPNYYYNRHTICADRVEDGVFYGRNNNVGYVRSDDYGETWELVHSLVGGIHANARLVSTPGKAGHLLYSSGPSGYVNFGGAMKRSTDGGTTWTDTNTGEVLCMGFGKGLTTSYPSIYIIGWVDNTYGIYRSDDEMATWERIGDYPMGCFDTPVDICGDLDTHGVFYTSIGASGIFKYL
jgi:photosystem II stability/assembly factor-like uncharacterized protein